MTWKKSSSIVKWILIISILELVIPNLLYLVPSIQDKGSFKNMGNLANYFMVLNVGYYLIVLYFIFQFYRRYKEISVLDDAKSLMRKIIKVRKTVKHYIIFCLSMVLLMFGIFIVGVYLDDAILLSIEGTAEKTKEVPLEKIKSLTMWVLGITGILFTLVIGGVYFLLYGLLLRKLNANYKELQRLEV